MAGHRFQKPDKGFSETPKNVIPAKAETGSGNPGSSGPATPGRDARGCRRSTMYDDVYSEALDEMTARCVSLPGRIAMCERTPDPQWPRHDEWATPEAEGA